MDTSMDILSTEYEILNSNVTELHKVIENKNQLIYNCKKQIAVATALEGDYMQEIEALQSNADVKVTELQNTIKELEDGIVRFRQSADVELLRKSDLIESLRKELKEMKSGSNNENKKRKVDTVDRDAERNSRMKEEVKVLNDTLVELQTNIDNLLIHNTKLEQTNNNYVVRLDNAKETCTYKTQELIETKNIIQNLQEEYFLIKLELESLKNKPLDAEKKGNSLFAEVEDSRIKTEHNIKQIKKRYAELKRDVCNKLKQMTSLRAQNSELSDELNFIKTYDKEREKVIEECKIKVTALESAIEQYKEGILKEQQYIGKDLPGSTVEFVNAALKSNWNDVEKARDDLNCISKKKLETFINIRDANTKMRECRRNALKLKIKIEKLENTILEIQLQSSPTLENPEDAHEQKSSSVPNTIEDVLKRSTIEIRKKSNVDGTCTIKQVKQNKPLALYSELNQEMLTCPFDLEMKPLDIKQKNECAPHYPEMKHNDSSLIISNNVSEMHLLKSTLQNISTEVSLQNMPSSHFVKKEAEQNKENVMAIFDTNTTEIENLNSKAYEPKLESIKPNILCRMTEELKLANESYAEKNRVQYQRDSNEVRSKISNSKSSEPEMLESMISDIIKNRLEPENKSYVKENLVECQSDDSNESVPILENISEIQLLKPKISTEPSLQNIQLPHFTKREVIQNKENITATFNICNTVNVDISNSKSSEPKGGLIEPEICGASIDEVIKEELKPENNSYVEDNLVKDQDDLDESVIILENISELKLLKTTSHNISAVLAEQNIPSLNCIKRELDQSEQNKTTFLDNISGSEILNSSSFEAAVDLIDPTMSGSSKRKIIKDGTARKQNESDTEEIVVEHQDDHDESVIFVQNISGIKVIESTSPNISMKPINQKMQDTNLNKTEHKIIKHKSITSEHQVYKSKLFNKETVSHLVSTVDFLSTDNNSDIINISDDEKQSFKEKNEMGSFKPIKCNNSIGQETLFKNTSKSEMPMTQLRNQGPESNYEMPCMSNAGHIPAKQLNKHIYQLNAGHTPAAHQKRSVTRTPAGNPRNVENLLESGKRRPTPKTNIPVPIARKLN